MRSVGGSVGMTLGVGIGLGNVGIERRVWVNVGTMLGVGNKWKA